jgi:hypothetical protein
MQDYGLKEAKARTDTTRIRGETQELRDIDSLDIMLAMLSVRLRMLVLPVRRPY